MTQDTTFFPGDDDTFLVTEHSGRVSFHCRSIGYRVCGFSLSLRVEHIPQVEELLEALRKLEAHQDQPTVPPDVVVV